MRWILPLALSVTLLAGCGEQKDDTAEPDRDQDGFGLSEDCDETDPDINPGAPEVCNGTDDDCDGSIDEEGAEGSATFFADQDGDSYGDPDSTVQSCEAPDGYVGTADDCDDTDAASHPTGTEVCDGADNDCDGDTDEDAADAAPWYLDGDGDSWGDAADVEYACDRPGGRVEQAGDCDDDADAIHPEADERCNGVDDDCDGDTDEDDAVDAVTWFRDRDGDGYGDSDLTRIACDPPSGYVENALDCNDVSDRISPGAAEVCDDTDNDCDGDEDEDAVDAATWFADADGDTCGDPAAAQVACDQPTGFVADATDCDDGDSAISPRATELCDGADNDCDGTVDAAGLVTLDGARNYGNIGLALRAATAGASVRVCDGTYSESITITTDLDLASQNGAAVTIIDAGGTGPAISIEGGAVSLMGFSLTGGEGDLHPDNPAYTVGGGLLLLDTEPVVVQDCALYDNQADFGAAIFVNEGGTLTLSDSSLELNDAENSGGGLYGWDATIAIDGVIFEDNLATYGGGLYLDGGELELNAASFVDNYASFGGGAYAGTDSSVVASADTLFTDNTASDWGGGLYLEAILGWSGAELDGNSAEYGGGFYAATDGVVVNAIEDLICGANDADVSGGGGYLAGDATLTDVQVTDNTAAWGGGLFVDSATAYLVNGVVEDNTAGGAGGGAYLYGAAELGSVNSDWGSGSTDNDPDDVFLDTDGVSYAAWGSAATFTCDDGLGACY